MGSLRYNTTGGIYVHVSLFCGWIRQQCR